MAAARSFLCTPAGPSLDTRRNATQTGPMSRCAATKPKVAASNAGGTTAASIIQSGGIHFRRHSTCFRKKKT
eukprot:CAMPEP_0175955464 /NCGR_PEP_ID=MMETSP0108-20121206/32516_1 /TAXON_ID=195067 ORGANISM="Goniomonas pacifica, Strain CCMP1869" /NCGR_SAMPLE_ID=MMETSP0108 /ASSEMBLY_ACC=CAM_ASM_000204 /LENGTH=71 /DNA_ID=CAMNT_0017282329 /DNA_START=206 /DNA_END=421 /DNA_ORIENTATION=-